MFQEYLDVYSMHNESTANREERRGKAMPGRGVLEMPAIHEEAGRTAKVPGRISIIDKSPFTTTNSHVCSYKIKSFLFYSIHI